MNPALTRFSRRHTSIRPSRAVLTLLSVLLGVAAVASVDMLSNSIRNANQRMFATVAGSSNLEISTTDVQGLPQSLVGVIESTLGVAAVVPVVQRPAVLFTGDEETNQRTRLYVMGVDPTRDDKLRDHEVVEGRFVRSGDEVVLEHDFARILNVKLNDEVRLLGGRSRTTLTVVGLLKTTAHARTTSGSLVFIPLENAQRIFLRGQPRVDQIQVMYATGTREAEVTAAIKSKLPEGATARLPAGRTSVLDQTMMSTEQGLDVSAYFIALLGAFIVFNTFLMNVSERRRQLAILRAVGATQGQITNMLIRESLVLGVIGTALGLLFGWQGTQSASLIFSEQLGVEFPTAQLTPSIALKAITFGLGMSLVGVIYPAWQASQFTPLEGMSSLPPQPTHEGTNSSVWLGLGLMAVGLVLLVFTLQQAIPLHWGTKAAIMMLVGGVFLVAPLINPITRFLSRLFQFAVGPLAHLAQQQVTRHHLRTTLTAGVLFISAATGLGMSYSILDVVQNIRDWYQRALVGDFFVRAMLPDFATGLSAELPEELDREMHAVRGIRTLDTARFVKARSGDEEFIVATREFPSPDDLSFDLIQGNHDRVKLHAQLLAGEVAISSVLAQKLNVHLGDDVPLETPEGKQGVKIAAVVNEYAFGGLTIWMARPQAEKLLHITGVDAYIVRVEPGQTEQVRQQLEPICKKHGLLLHSFQDIHRTIDGIIAGTNFGLWLLVILGFVVASFGVVNTLAMNVLEQTRELGLLRIVAMTRHQVRRLILVQAMFLALLGLVPGVLVGMLMGFLMILASTISFAHPIKFGFHPELVAATFFGGIALVLVTALIPAIRASRLNILTALHME